MTTTFSTPTRFLVTAKGTCGIELVEGISPDHASFEVLRAPEDARSLLGPDSRRESVLSVVRLFDRFLWRPKCQYRQDWTKDLLARDAMCARDIGEDRWSEPETVSRDSAGGLPWLGSLILSSLGQFLDLLKLSFGVDRAKVGVLIHRITDADLLHPPLQFLDQEIMDVLLNQEA